MNREENEKKENAEKLVMKNAKKLVETLKELMESDTGLRQSQKNALEQFTGRTEAPVRGIFNLATGLGKTRIMSMLALAHLQNNPNSQIVVAIPTMELFKQEKNAFQEYMDFQNKQRKESGLPALSMPENFNMGEFNQDCKDTNSNIIFTTYHSLEKLSQSMVVSNVGLLLLDEAHHAVTDKKNNAVKSFTNAIHYGMTATPWYSPEKNAEKVLGEILATVSIEKAIHEVALAEFKNVLMISNLSVDLSKVAKDKATGDYKEADFCKAILKAAGRYSTNSGNEENWKEAHHLIAKEVAKLYHNYVDEHVGPLNGKKCLINCRSQEEARIQVNELNKLFGRIVAQRHTSDECKSETIQKFKDGDLLIVCQVGKLTEGFDMPNLDITINYPTTSLVREAQGAARCLRLPKVDSRTPQVTPKKMGLVVDIAFKHPAYDNSVDGIRANGQRLFQDVVGVKSPIIQHEDESLQIKEMTESELEKLRSERSYKTFEPLLEGFTIVSRVRDLLQLTREANESSAEKEYISTIREWMKTSTDLASEWKVRHTTIASLLEQAFEEGLPLVEKVKNHGQICYAVHEKGLEAFKKWISSMEKYRDLLTSPIRDEMKTANGLSREWGVDYTKIASLLEQAFKNRLTFDTDKEKGLPLVEWVKTRTGPACYAVHEKGLEAFKKWISSMEKYRDLLTPTIRKGMKTATDLENELNLHSTTIGRLLKHAFEEGLTFDMGEGEELPFVEKVKSRTGPACYAVHEKGLEAFKKWISSMEKYRDLLTPTIRKGMKTATDLENELNLHSTTIGRLLKHAFEEGLTFDMGEGEELPFVEKVKSRKGRACYAVHEKGLEAFKKWVEQTCGKKLKERTTSPTLEPRFKVCSHQGKSKTTKPSKDPKTRE